jgi:DNA-binding NarL/FixJ family response regulator
MKSTNGRYTPTQRVLIIDNRSIMGAGIETLLSDTRHLQIIGTAPQDENDLVNDVWQYSPDVIILSNQSQLTDPARLMTLLKRYRSFRLIVVNEDDNSMEVYEKRRVVARQRSDLATAVQQN